MSRLNPRCLIYRFIAVTICVILGTLIYVGIDIVVSIVVSIGLALAVYWKPLWIWLSESGFLVWSVDRLIGFKNRGVGTDEDFPFDTVFSFGKDLTTLLYPENSDNFDKMPYVSVRTKQIDDILERTRHNLSAKTPIQIITTGLMWLLCFIEKGPVEKDWILLTGPPGSGKTRELKELVERRFNRDDSFKGEVGLIYRHGSHKKDFGKIHTSLKLGGKKNVLIVVDNLHDCEGKKFLAELQAFAVNYLERQKRRKVRLILACLNQPSSIKQVGWNKDDTFWQRFERIDLGFLSKREFTQSVDIIAQRFNLDDQNRRFLIENRTATLEPVVKLFAQVDSSIGITSEDFDRYEQNLTGYWDRFREYVIDETPGANKIFQGIVWLQQLEFPLYNQVVIEIARRWDNSRINYKDVLSELMLYALPNNDDREVLEVLPGQFSNMRAIFGDSLDLEEFINVIKDFQNLFMPDLLFRAAYKLSSTYDQSEYGAELWRLVTDDGLDNLAQYNIGIACRQQELVPEAVEHLFSSIKTQPDLGTIFLADPNAYVASPNISKQEAVDLSHDKNLSRAYIFLYRELRTSGGSENPYLLDQARELASAAQEIDPNNVEVNVALAEVYEDQKKYKDSAQIYEGLVELKPDSAEILAQAAYVKYCAAEENAETQANEYQKEIDDQIKDLKKEREAIEQSLKERKPKRNRLLQSEGKLLDQLQKVDHTGLATSTKLDGLVKITLELDHEREQLFKQRHTTKQLLQVIDRECRVDSKINDETVKEISKSVEQSRENIPGNKFSEFEVILHALSKTTDASEERGNLLLQFKNSLNGLYEEQGNAIDNLQKQRDARAAERNALQRQHSEDEKMRLQRQIDNIQVDLNNLDKEDEKDQGELKEITVRIDELKRKRQTMSPEKFETNEFKLALRWARRAQEIDFSPKTQNLINQIESHLQDFQHG